MLAATDDPEVNGFVARLCREYGVPVNTADDANACDFYFPAILRKEELTLPDLKMQSQKHLMIMREKISF